MTTATCLGRSTAARLATVVAAGLLVVAATHEDGPLPSMARLTASSSTSAQTVTSGNIALALTNGAAAGQWTGSFSILPGGSAYYRLTVTNSGSADLIYSVASTTSAGTLAPYLTVSVAKLASGSSTCTSSTYAAGTVVSNSGTLPFGSGSGTNIIGDPASGSQTGDRTLVGGGSENLCMKVSFPLGTGLGYAGRGATSTTSFTFSAESL